MTERLQLPPGAAGRSRSGRGQIVGNAKGWFQTTHHSKMERKAVAAFAERQVHACDVDVGRAARGSDTGR